MTQNKGKHTGTQAHRYTGMHRHTGTAHAHACHVFAPSSPCELFVVFSPPFSYFAQLSADVFRRTGVNLPMLWLWQVNTETAPPPLYTETAPPPLRLPSTLPTM